MPIITSRDNARLKLARRVRDGRVRDLIFVEGLRLAEEALKSKIGIDEVFVSDRFERGERTATVLDEIQSRGHAANVVAEQHFQSIADTANPQGIVLLGRRPDTGQINFAARFADRRPTFPLVLLLHRVNNPSNLGAILRTAEAVGIAGVILTRNSADVFSPKSLRASMGAAFRLNLWTNAAFDEALSWARDAGLVTTAADVNAKKNYLETDWQRPRLLVFGSEAHGLTDDERDLIDELLVIPMAPEVESLNLAVACGVILFEAKRQTQN
ncbi:MAG: RNA methyltransferase [Acidobacteria bacterium]|nr:RNA methyltransferase [Acidobacteriota bacterium]